VRNHDLRRGRQLLRLQHSAVLAGTPTWPTATPGACGAAFSLACPTRLTYPEAGRVAQLLRGGLEQQPQELPLGIPQPQPAR